MSGGWHSASVKKVVVRLDGNIETAASERKKVTPMEGGGCAWMAPTVPPTALPAGAAVAGFAVVGDF